MKRYIEMKESELLALTDEQLSKLIDYECALEGVPMLPPHPGPAPVKSAPKPDAKVYEVAGVLTLDPGHAGRILAAITEGQLFKIEYNSDSLKPLNGGDYSYPEIKTKTAHSLEQWAAIKADVEAYESAKKAHDQVAKVYNDAFKERQGIVNAISDALSNARRNEYTRRNLRDEFTRYLDLAEGNNRVALNFLEKAKGHVLADFPELKEEFCPTVECAEPLTDLRAEDCGGMV